MAGDENLAEKVLKLERNCKNAILAKSLLVCDNYPKCLLGRAEQQYGTSLLCKYEGWKEAYAKYEEAKAKAKEMNVPVGTDKWFDFVRNHIRLVKPREMPEWDSQGAFKTNPYDNSIGWKNSFNRGN